MSRIHFQNILMQNYRNSVELSQIDLDSCNSVEDLFLEILTPQNFI